MFYSRQKRNNFFAFVSSICFMLTLFLGVMLTAKTNVFAEEIEVPPYLSITSNQSTFSNQDTVFLDENENLVITLGKPLCDTTAIEDGSNLKITKQSDIGEYALNNLVSAFSLKINNIDIHKNTLEQSGLLTFTHYLYQPSIVDTSTGTEIPTGEEKQFTYMTLKIDLSQKTIFSSGEYTFSFTNYIQNSQTDFSLSEGVSFSFTLFIFNTTDYFSSNDATSQNVTFNNVETQNPMSINYRNYYYFNYSNLNTNSYVTTANHLPTLSFDASKFILNISKTVSGNKYSCEISKFNQNLVTLGQTTTKDFIYANFNPETDQIDIVFNDIGEYILEYTFVFHRPTTFEVIELQSDEIDAIKTKNDVLYILGYQMYFGGEVKEQNEFKALNETKTQTLDYQSADVTYLIDQTNAQKIKSKTPETDFDAEDETIKNIIQTKGVNPVSTNQPAIVLNSNANLNSALSHFYMPTFDKATSTWTWGEAQAFQDKPFTASGTYLVRLVYNYDNYYDNYSLSKDTQFVQYFFFTIDNTIPSFTAVENITDGNLLLNDTYTKNDVLIALAGQSRFNSQVNIEIYTKAFGSSFYTLSTTLIASAEETTHVVAQEGNYLIKLLYGKNLNKSKTLYFTIDKTEISGLQVLPVSKNQDGSYKKDNQNIIEFFSAENVVVEWNEKLSGASTKAYYKYIPFTQNTDSLIVNVAEGALNRGIATTSKLSLDLNKIYDKASYTNSKNRINSSNIFTNQGLYIVYVTDEAGHETYTAFCIDRSSIQVLQTDSTTGQSKFVTAYDTVSTQKILAWGDYKLIPVGIKTDEIATIQDPWIKRTFENLYNPNGSQGKDNMRSLSSKLYLSVEIADVFALQTGTSLKLITNNQTSQTTISPFGNTGTMEYANEITYQYFFIDESNLLFKEFNALFGNSTSQAQAENFAFNADKTFQITTTTDASNAQVLINPTQSINDVSLLNSDAIALSQAGFADSNTETSTLQANLRTKYYFTTGATLNGDVSILSYKLKLNIESNFVQEVVMYFYPFVIDTSTGTKVLSTTAIKTIIYNYNEPQNSLFTALTDAENQDYYAFNINVDYNNLTNSYHTLSGKYVIQRTYNDENFVNKYDFLSRESVFIVDREDIVSSPESINGESKSSVGGAIFVNILDGHENAVQFTNIYSAKNNNNTYILQTNKLPVVVYVPTSKYGTYTKDAYNQFTFTQDKTLSSYFLTNGEKLIRYSYLNNQESVQEEAYLKMVYFGEIILTDNFATNSNVYKNTDFDLTVTITANNGKVIETYKTNVNSIGYITSSPILASGIYHVTITQNTLNGQAYPNVYNTFKFSFQIVDQPPTFAYTESTQTDYANLFDTDKNGIFYTNEQDKIKVMWTDPQDTTYFASIDTTAKENGTTSIKYYFTNAEGINISATYSLLARDIIVDYTNGNKYFFIDLTNIPNNSILNVYMQNQRGVINENATQSERNLFEAMTSVTKKLYIDRTAPSQILDSLIAKTTLNGFSLASYTRKYINFDGTEATNNEKLYNVPITDGAFARYAFAVANTEANPLEELFAPKNPINSFYTEGYYYHIEKVADIAQYAPPPNLASAIATTKTYQNQVVQAFSYNTYYEIIEIDLAGNVAIYLIYVTDNDNKNVLQFSSEKTDKEIKNYINFDELSENQNIFAKGFLKITNISLRNYAFLQFALDGETYFMSTALPQTQCYTFSLNPQIVNIAELLSFSAPSVHTLVINDSVKAINYTFNIYVTNNELSFNLLNASTQEGIYISSPQSAVLQYLSSITISSYDKGLDRYVVIYDANGIFNSNNFVSVTTQNNSYTFQILNPDLAYSYVFYDNYGIEYIEHHSAGSFVLDEKDKIKNHIDEVLITENIDGEPITNSWFVGKNNITYNYSSADYYAYIKIYVLNVSDEKIEWQELSQSSTSPYGIAISDQSNYSITSGNLILCTIKESPIHETVKELVLYAPSQNILANFTGGAYKFEITLIDQYDSSNTNRIIDRILINNLTPIIDLKDKNYESVYADNAIYSEQLTIVIPSLPNSFTSNPQISNFMLGFTSQLVFNQSALPLTSGTIVEEAGNYEVQIFVKVNEEYYLVSSKMFVITQSSSAFYEVVVRDPSTGTFVTASKTGKPFTYNQTVCYNHYIVNDEFEVFLNENQMMEEISRFTVESTECTTLILKLSNFASAKTNNISPYETTIAISRIERTNSIITNNLFTYETNDGSSKALSGTSQYIAITQSDSDVNHITIRFNSYYAIAENIITATIHTENQVFTVTGQSNLTQTSFTITNSGDYTISFTDLAGNVQLFSDAGGIEQAYFYKIRFIKGVAYLINGQTPIQNAIYNDSVTITLPNTLSSVYDIGGKPSIVVIKNDQEITITPENNAYTISEAGYYKVYFNARVKDQELRQEAYEFLILASKEYKSNFEFTEYGDYEIVSIIKNGQDFTSNIRKLYGLAQNDALKNIAISLYDEKTGQGNYQLTIKTNSGLKTETENGLIDESFTFDFIIKSVGAMPLTISLNEGESTTDAIYIEFNAYDLYTDIGECVLIYGKHQLKINQEYLNSLNENYFCSLPITETGTHFIQVYNSSDTLLYSYKVTKTEPLNTVSILLIVGGVLAVGGLTVTIVLLRKRMKIK